MAIEDFQIGDIILTRNNSLMGRMNAIYQKHRRKHCLNDLKPYKFIPTHAALVLNHTEVIQSHKRSSQPKNAEKSYPSCRHFIQFLNDTRKKGLGQALRQVEHGEMLNLTRLLLGHGVDIDKKFLQILKPFDTFVIRHPGLANNPNLHLLTAEYHLGKPYNPLIEAFDGKGITVFCSQLIYTIFKETGLEMPPQPAHHVLPVDFLIWATTHGWQIATHEQVQSLHLQYKRYLDVCSPIDFNTAERHKATVEKIQLITQIEQKLITDITLVADIIQGKRELVRPSRSDKSFISRSDPISFEQIILAGDIIFDSLTGCNPPDVNIPSDAENLLEGKKLSWLLETGISAEPNHTTLDVQLIGCKSTIKAVERLLSSFDIAFKNVIAYLYTQADTSNIIQTQLDNNTSHRDKLFEAFWFIAEFFERNKDKEEIESLWTSGPEKIKTMSKQILDEFQQLDGKYEARTQGGEQLSQASKAFLATVVRCHAYGCAFDFLTICEGLAELDELLANNNFTLSDLYQHHSQAFLAVLTAMNRPQKLRDWTHKFIDTLPPSIKRYWDNI